MSQEFFAAFELNNYVNKYLTEWKSDTDNGPQILIISSKPENLGRQTAVH